MIAVDYDAGIYWAACRFLGVDRQGRVWRRFRYRDRRYVGPIATADVSPRLDAELGELRRAWADAEDLGEIQASWASDYRASAI